MIWWLLGGYLLYVFMAFGMFAVIDDTQESLRAWFKDLPDWIKWLAMHLWPVVVIAWYVRGNGRRP